MQSTFHKAAIAYARRGIPVFPCAPGDKRPATENGYKDATTDLGQIDAWWSANPNFNPAFCPDQKGWSVVDLDGPIGRENWETAQIENGYAPTTFEVATPRDGSHLYFVGELPGTVGTAKNKRAIAPHIDTRGVGTYVLLPPSIILTYTGDDAKFNGGVYKTVNSCVPAVVPDWIVKKTMKRALEVEGTERIDAPSSIATAERHLQEAVKQGRVAIEGAGGDDTTYQLALELRRDLGISHAKTFQLMGELWYPHCKPNDNLEWLEFKIQNAGKYGENGEGAWAVAPAAEKFASVLDTLKDEPEQPARRSRFYFEDEEEQDQAKDTVMLIKDLVPDATTVLIVGEKGSFKSFVLHELLLATASGVPTFGTLPCRTGPTFYGTHEGANDLKRGRRRAWRQARGIETAIPIFVAPAPRVVSPEECEEFREQIRARLRLQSLPIAGIGLDTVAKCMVGLDENSAADMGMFVSFCDSLVFEFDCPVYAVAHTPKGGKGARGSGALEAGFGTVIDVKRPDPHGKLVEVSVRYHKDAEEPEQPWTFEARKVGTSLALYPISQAEYIATKEQDDPFARDKVGQALITMGAFGQDNMVTSSALALQLNPGLENEPPEVQLENQKKSAAILNKLSRSTLKNYAYVVGRDTVWFMPQPTVQ